MITVQDIAYVRYGAPDLDAMKRFLTGLGLHVARDSGTALYMGAADGRPFAHVTERTDRSD